MIWFHVFVHTEPRSVTHRPRPDTESVSPKSHQIRLFADPHPLNSVVSYRCKNGGRGGLRRSYRYTGTLPRLISFVCHSYENTGGVGVFFPFWNSFPAVVSQTLPTGPRCAVSLPMICGRDERGLGVLLLAVNCRLSAFPAFCLEAPDWA